MTSVLLLLAGAALAGPGHDHGGGHDDDHVGHAPVGPPEPTARSAKNATAMPTVAPGAAPLVVVRPLPAVERPVLEANYTKAQLIAAMGRTSTIAFHELAVVDHPDGELVSAPATFACKITAGILTVSYVREGFVTDGLPPEGTCGKGDGAFTFRIEVAPAPAQGL